MTIQSDPALLAAIERFEIDPGIKQQSFVDRLAQENHWHPSFAARVVKEYKRFVYLAMISPTPVTPSNEVDQAWHLHLAYTRSYWDRFMPILPRTLHHGPTAGGEAEDNRYRQQYHATLALYRSVFGQAPPREIWPPSSRRFAARHRRVDLTKAWVVERQWGLLAALVLGPSVLAPTVVSLVSGSPRPPSAGPQLFSSSVVLHIIFGGVLTAVLLFALLKPGRRGSPSEVQGGGCSGCSNNDGTGCGSSGSSGCGSSGCGSSGCGGGGCGGD